MKYILTSSPALDDRNELNNAFGFTTFMKQIYRAPIRALYVASVPNDMELTTEYANRLKESFETSGFKFLEWNILDLSTSDMAEEWIKDSDLVILAGGHTPTENMLFTELGLKDLLKSFSGALMGISAGSMNMAETVYAQPEEEGEAVDPGYVKFFPGLGFTKSNVIPHYDYIKDLKVDGLDPIDEIAVPDSVGRKFYVLRDGSFIVSSIFAQELVAAGLLGNKIDGGEIIIGDYFEIRDGKSLKPAFF